MNALVAVVLLGATYVVGSLAIDTGRWSLYVLTAISLLLALKFFTSIFMKHGKA